MMMTMGLGILSWGRDWEVLQFRLIPFLVGVRVLIWVINCCYRTGIVIDGKRKSVILI